MFRSILLIALLLFVTAFSTSCDHSFYLSEKEFFALRALVADQNLANQNFNQLNGQLLRVTFNNSVSPPRVQSTNLLDVMRNGIPSLAIYEGYPNYALHVDRVTPEIEAQFDNWLSDQLRLYAGENNSESRLERVDEMRVLFVTNPTFVYTPGKITFNVTVNVSADCGIRVSGVNWFINFLFGGLNGSYNTRIDLNNLRLQGEITDDISTNQMVVVPSRLTFKLTPTLGTVDVASLPGSTVPTAVANGIRSLVTLSLHSPLETTVGQAYDNFALSDCRIGTEFTCQYHQRPYAENPALTVVARGTDNQLYTATRIYDGWSDYTQLCCNGTTPGIFTTDPTLAVSGGRTVELAATTASGQLFYGQQNIAGMAISFITPPAGTTFKGKPSIVATAPGQLEIFVLRGDNRVLHLRKNNGTWSIPTELGLPTTAGMLPFRDPIAVQSGNKIFLATVASNGQLYALVFDLETGLWGQSANIPTTESVRYAPALASSGDGRIDLVYVGTSGAAYHRPININSNHIVAGVGTSGFSLSSEVVIPGNLTATPILVSNGYRQLGLVGRGTDNHLYYNHFTGPQSPTGLIDGRNITPGWSGWGDLNADFIGTQNISNENTEEFAVTATKSGKMDLVARIRTTLLVSSYGLHHNSFDSADFGSEPWKTVAWRGYQRMGTFTANGRPALAALDNNFASAFVGQGANVYETDHGYDIAPLLGLPVLAGNTPIDPIIVSSGKGLVDLVVVGSDRKIRHVRYLNNLRSVTTILPGQTNLSFQTRPTVVGYGEGQVEVVAVTTTGAIYHWRYINGVWQNPVTISGTVSSPVLVNTGAGQLELFAIGGDNKLYRWRFLNGAWENWQQLPSTFTINSNKFGQGSAATSGDGVVDLAVVTNQAGTLAYYRKVEPRDDTVSLPGLPAQTFQSVGGGANSQPFIGAISRIERFIIFANQSSSDFDYYTYNPSIAGVYSWRLHSLWGAGLGLQIGGIADTPFGSVAVATDVNGQVYFNDRLDKRGSDSDFAPIPRQASLMWLRLPRFRPAVASFGGP